MLKKIVLLSSIFISLTVCAEGLTVYGLGSIAAEPDVVELTLVVEERGLLASKMKTLVDAKTKQIIEIALDEKVAQQDIHSMLVHVQPIYSRRDSVEQELKHQGFIVRRTINMSLRDLERYDLVLDKMLRVGSTYVQNIRFALSNQSDLYRKALNIALRDATVKAAELAEQGNVTLGLLNRVEEVSHYNAPVMEARMMSNPTSASLPGLVSVQAKVQASFEIN